MTTYVCRPAIGLIVEGRGEYAAFPSLVTRVLNGVPHFVPCVQDDGWTGIYYRLDEQLDALVAVHHPFSVIVTVDLIDVLEAGVEPDCASLRQKLAHDVNKWLTTRRDDPKFNPLPEYIEIVLQVPMVEGWLVAGIESLAHSGFVTAGLSHASGDNTDDMISKPVKYLDDHALHGINTKDPAELRALFGICSVDKMVEHSRSFRKWHKEVRSFAGRWSICVAEECRPVGAD